MKPRGFATSAERDNHRGEFRATCFIASNAAFFQNAPARRNDCPAQAANAHSGASATGGAIKSLKSILRNAICAKKSF